MGSEGSLTQALSEIVDALCAHDDGKPDGPAWDLPCPRLVYGRAWTGEHETEALVTAAVSAGGALIEQDASGKRRLVIPLE